MNVREPRLSLRRQRVINLGLSGLGTATAFTLCNTLSSLNKMGAILVPATLVSTLVLGVMLSNRIRARQRWLAAWETYATVDLARNSFRSVEKAKALSLVRVRAN